MTEKTFKVLRKNGEGYPFPYTEVLAKQNSMVESELTAAEISALVSGVPVVSNSQRKRIDIQKAALKSESPGKGWTLNSKGNWVRKEGAVKKHTETKINAPAPDNE
jgi:hypothetical protein